MGYAMSLAPLEEVELAVIEEACYAHSVTGARAIGDWLESKQAKELLATGVLNNELLGQLQIIVENSKLRQTLSKVETFNFTDQDLHHWQSGAVPAPLLEKLLELRAVEARAKDLDRQAKVYAQHVQQIFTNQERLRSNIQSLEKVASNKLVDRYLTDLDHEEDDLIATNNLIKKAQEDMIVAVADANERKLVITAEAAERRANL